MRAHQVVVSASPGDAVTSAALALRGALRRLGESEIFARYYDPALAGEVLPLGDYARRAPVTRAAADDLLVVHASIGEPDVAAFLAGRPERLVLVYHNISPAEPFHPYDAAFAARLEAGRRELADLRPRVSLALADSAYNAAELEALGYADVRVSPLPVDATSLCGVDSDQATAHHLATEMDGPVLVFVGQLLPHKRPDLLVAAFHVMCTYLDPDAHLVLVGPARLARYRRVVQHLVGELSLAHAWIAGPVSEAALAAFYRRADAFVTASEHEGFCLPVLEAMAFGLPVLARRCAALPETVGDAGLLLPADAGPELLAEAMHRVLTDRGLRAGLVAAGRRRLEELSPERALATALGHLREIA